MFVESLAEFPGASVKEGQISLIDQRGKKVMFGRHFLVFIVSGKYTSKYYFRSIRMQYKASRAIQAFNEHKLQVITLNKQKYEKVRNNNNVKHFQLIWRNGSVDQGRLGEIRNGLRALRLWPTSQTQENGQFGKCESKPQRWESIS